MTSVSPPRYPIEIIRRLAPPAPVRLGGRVVATKARSALVQDITDRVWVDCEVVPPEGAWVIGVGEWNGERVHEGRCQLLNVPRFPFPQLEGDWSWFQDQNGKRAANLHQRAEILRHVREFFHQRAFLEVETPHIVPSPGLDVHLDAFPVGEGPEDRGYLITSPEYHMKRLLAGGLPRLYQVCRCFRRGEEGPLHQPEFTMVEWYRAFHRSTDVMRDTQELVAHVTAAIYNGSHVIPARGTPVDVSPPWEKVTVREAFQRYAGLDLDGVLPDLEKFFRVFVEAIQPQLGRLRPVFLTAWPASMASLARLDPRDPTVADRFEAFIDGVEICNGFGELVDPLEQRERFQRDQETRHAAGLPVYPIDERFISALEEGMPPSAGNALGLDRLVMLVLGVRSLADIVAFPASRV